MRARIAVETTNYLCLSTDAERDVQNAVIQQLRADIRDINRKHNAIVTRETYALVALKRKNYFAEASLRQLRGEVRLAVSFPCPATMLTLKAGPQRIPLAATRNVPVPPSGHNRAAIAGKENEVPGAASPSNLPRGRVSRPAVSDPMDDALEIIYNFILE